MFVLKVLGVENVRTRPAVGLYAVIVLGVLRDVDRSPASEALVSTVVQSLCSVSLKSSCVDLRAASYMILSQLCNTTTLNETTVQSLMAAFSQVVTLPTSLSQFFFVY
jgi:U3 small nucleolar RNA-associated protein 10